MFKGDESKGLARRDTVTQVINKELPKTASDRTILSGISQYLDGIYAASVQKSVEADERLKSTFFDPLVHPIFFSKKDFLEIERFSTLAFGTTTEQGLSLDDSRYVYDKINRRIRPIYYDGHPSPELKHKTKNKQLPFFIQPETIIEILLSVQRVDASYFSNKLASRGWTTSVADVNTRLVNIAKNLETAIPFPIHDKKIVAKNITDFVLLKRDREGASAKRTIVDVREVASGVYMEPTGCDTVIIDKTNSKVTAYVKSGEMVNTMHPFTSNPMLRIYGGSLSDWHFMVKYPANLKTLSRRSRGGLEYTGCVLFHDIKLTNLKIEVDNAPCEDAINLVRGNASELILNVNNSFADAIDADFSVVKEMKANVRNAENDCLDFSFGKVSVTPILIGCGGKGVSVGEKTYAEIRNGLIKNTKVGVSSKDGSVVKIDDTQILDTSVCLASCRKKLKFHGGVIA
ncbi:hypothetical protein OAV31_00060 [bacterium]|nr:hypothetical protein [bacterium]